MYITYILRRVSLSAIKDKFCLFRNNITVPLNAVATHLCTDAVNAAAGKYIWTGTMVLQLWEACGQLLSRSY